MRPRLVFASLLLSALPLSAAAAPPKAAAAAEAAAPTAEQIVEKALNKGALGFRQGSATLQMKIVPAKGETKDNTLELKAMRTPDGLLHSIVKFKKPAKVAGIAFLVHEKKDALPDQYVYVPEAKVVRRIAAGNATSSFFGSDFTFGDLMPLPVSQRDKVQITKLPDQEVGGQQAYVLEVVPKIEGSPYGKIVAYVQKDALTPLKVEFFDPGMKALKTLSVKKLKKVDEELIPVELHMESVAGSRTELLVENVDPKAKLSESDFTEEAMQR
jgi:hypothetical protein